MDRLRYTIATMAFLGLVGCESVQDLEPATSPVTLVPLAETSLEAAPGELVSLTVQARDEAEQPVNGTPVYFFRVTEGIGFGAQPLERALVTTTTKYAEAGGFRADGVASADVAFPDDATLTEATVVAGLALPSESSLNTDSSNSASFFVIYRIANSMPQDGGAGGTGGAASVGGGGAGGSIAAGGTSSGGGV